MLFDKLIFVDRADVTYGLDFILFHLFNDGFSCFGRKHIGKRSVNVFIKIPFQIRRLVIFFVEQTKLQVRRVNFVIGVGLFLQRRGWGKGSGRGRRAVSTLSLFP